MLFWKTALLLFGSFHDIDVGKDCLRDQADICGDENNRDFITASPLDYHLFRQEITSKYPAYSPPQPLVPIELENNSVLPPLPNHPSRQASQERIHVSMNSISSAGAGSIFNQPVHIATPAPSPPPSPAGPGGKGGKKQNYQTNQNFPFLYPPLDDTVNAFEGKSSNESLNQASMKRWEGSDVPTSILEAGQLFASRMRMSRSLRQLWDVRENFIKYERGWNESLKPNMRPESPKSSEEDKSSASPSGSMNDDDSEKISIHAKETDNPDVQRRLDAVNDYYVRTPASSRLVHADIYSSVMLYLTYSL